MHHGMSCCTVTLRATLRTDFTSQLVHGLAFGIPKFYIAPYDKINHRLVNLSSMCDVKSGLSIIINQFQVFCSLFCFIFISFGYSLVLLTDFVKPIKQFTWICFML